MTPVFFFSRARAHSGRQGVTVTADEPISTVPLLCSRGGFEVKDVDEVEGGVAQLEGLEPRPQVDDVALDAGIEFFAAGPARELGR
jgi:hypothetical protein